MIDNKKMWESLIRQLYDDDNGFANYIYTALKEQGLMCKTNGEIMCIEPDVTETDNGKEEELTEEDLQSNFELELIACQVRYPEVSFAKMSRIAKRFYDLGRRVERNQVVENFDIEKSVSDWQKQLYKERVLLRPNMVNSFRKGIVYTLNKIKEV